MDKFDMAVELFDKETSQDALSEKSMKQFLIENGIDPTDDNYFEFIRRARNKLAPAVSKDKIE